MPLWTLSRSLAFVIFFFSSLVVVVGRLLLLFSLLRLFQRARVVCHSNRHLGQHQKMNLSRENLVFQRISSSPRVKLACLPTGR